MRPVSIRPNAYLSLSLSNEYIVAMWTRIKSFRKNETVEKNVYAQAHAYAETGRDEWTNTK